MAINRYLASGTHVEDPPVAKLLFANTKMAWFWLVVRLYVGYEWLEAGLHKFQDPKWMGDGSALLGYWKGAVARSGGRRYACGCPGRRPERGAFARGAMPRESRARASEPERRRSRRWAA